MTEREVREVREQWDRAHSRWSAVCDAIGVMRKVADDLSAERGRLAEIIAEHDNTPIMTVVEPQAAKKRSKSERRCDVSGDKAADLDQLRTQLKHWWTKEDFWWRQASDATMRYDAARKEVSRLKARIAAAEAAAEQRIVTEDDGSPE